MKYLEQLNPLVQQLKTRIKKIDPQKSGRLFQTIFLVLCLLLVCMLSYVTFFTHRFVLQAQTEELHRSNLTMLNHANDSITQMTKDLEQQARMFLSDQAVLHHLLSNQFCTSEMRMHILQSMKNYVSLTPEVSSLWLYAPLTNTVLSSDGFLNDRYDSTITPILTRFERQDIPRSASDLRLSSVIQEGNLYILIDFIPAERLGCFVFQLDLQRLGLTLDPELPPIMVTDSSGNLLLKGNALPLIERWFDLSESELYYQELGTQTTKQQSYYRVTNDLLDWTLLMEFSGDSHSSAIFWATVIPFLLVLLLLGVPGAYYITKKIYAPIDRLIRLTAAANQPGTLPGNEVDFLESAFQETLHANRSLRLACSAQKREVRQLLFREAIAGRFPDSFDPSFLRSFIPEGVLYAALIRLGNDPMPTQAPDGAPTLEDLLSQMPECLCWLEEPDDAWLLILHFPHIMVEPHSPQSWLDAFLARVREQLGRQALCGLGGGCTAPHQLKESYEQARQTLRYHIYLDSDPDPATAYSLKNKTLTAQLSQILAQPTQTPEEIQAQANHIVQLTEEGAEDEVERLQRYELAQSLISEKLSLWGGDSSVQDDSPEEDPLIQDRDEFLEYCTLALETGQSMAGKKKYRYVEESKAYIQEHYMNPTLSANDISAHVGISPSYFSSLFNDLVKESVTSYLNRVRVEQAKKLLANTKMPIKEIVPNCGFNSPNVFGRVFKKYTGQSPSQYRDSCAAQQEGVKPNGQIS